MGPDFDVRMAPYLECAAAPGRLGEAVRYSMLAPGKRLRPYLVETACRYSGGTSRQAEPVAVAVECLHVFTLIHDDLPCMDDAETRRGRPACHRAFGEAIATLAGDALLALAFELIASAPLSAATAVRAIRELAEAVGYDGVIAGQVDDIAATGGAPFDLEQVQSIHCRKTARLLQCACRLGALAAEMDTPHYDDLSDYGLHVGFAFQIADDLLDSNAGTGKPAGADVRLNKATYPALLGPEASLEAGRRHVAAAMAAIRDDGPVADELRGLARFVLTRTH